MYTPVLDVSDTWVQNMQAQILIPWTRPKAMSCARPVKTMSWHMVHDRIDPIQPNPVLN